LYSSIEHGDEPAGFVSVGAIGTGHSLGISLAADNRYEPFLGGSEAWTNARYNNSAAVTWRSVAVVWTAASNAATLYVNAVSIGSDSVARALTAGPAVLGAAPDGSLKSNNGELQRTAACASDDCAGGADAGAG